MVDGRRWRVGTNQPYADRPPSSTINLLPSTIRQPHSYLSASTGSNLDARIAGSIPNSTPITALAPRAATTAMGGTDAAMGLYWRTSTATPSQ